MTITAADWLGAFAARLGIETPDDVECEAILNLAGTVAHASERRAAPIACWLAARAGLSVEEAMMLALEVSTTSSNPDASHG